MSYSLTVNGLDTALMYISKKSAQKAFEIAKADPSTNWATIVRTSRKDCDVIAYYDRSDTKQ